MLLVNSLKQRGLNAISSLRAFYSPSRPIMSMDAAVPSTVQDEVMANRSEKLSQSQPCDFDMYQGLDKTFFVSDVKDDDLMARLKSLFRECPQMALLTPLLVLYHTEFNMSVWSYDSHLEREKIVKNFTQICLSVTATVTAAGYWCDFIDPTSGMPYHGCYSNETLTDCDEDFHRLSDILSLEDIGCCRALRHTDWDFNVFAGLLVTDAPNEILMEAYKSANLIM